MISITRMNNVHERRKLSPGHVLRKIDGFTVYEVELVNKIEGGKVSQVPFDQSKAMAIVLPILHGKEDPVGYEYTFTITLKYYYIKDGRAIYLKRDVYELILVGISRGAKIVLNHRRGLLRVTPEELVQKIVEKAKQISQSSLTLDYLDSLVRC